MYSNYGNPSGMQMPPQNSQPVQFDNPLYGASSGLIRSGIGVYGEKFLGSSSEFMQSNINRYFSNPQYYFHVNDQYVRNKLKVILFPFFHRGHWTRISEPVGGRLSYKPPIYDINAPDLYIPFMAFGSFIILSGFTLGFMGKFTPAAINLQFTRALIGWGFQLMVLKGLLYSMGGGEVPLLDLVAYGGYLFAGLSLAVVARLMWAYSYYVMMPWMSLCMGVFLVRTMKRVLFTEMRSSERHSSRQHYFLLFMAIAQFPLFFWLGSIGA
ncbi:hypothetical protein Zm00014a_000594 [Zea mays]|uniref:Protein YIF1B-B n=2 Tax=Zea mays TaxID=4577 RepID=A0A3L6FGJ8_MAIZE|nr:protein YIF1A [Zea mays]PWZ30805.1 hypothetical protein Zm00014a_000594 [Zea mays]PWZ30806.1 Protein YIF1B-B [Zea mays]PWZ30807.1 hypothetical protein Zm00014a_000594 [Zea mays]PWZ30808.1 hypothetical protein Zm00014a_000594 [Zea mays]|eukprot:NP_001152217.1 protein YIF1A [Zea mays]